MKLEPANLVCPACGNGNYMRHLVGKNVGWLNLKCINCNSYFNLEDLVNRGVKVPKAKTTQQTTNFDKVRQLSLDEFCEWYWWILVKTKGYTVSRIALKDWLQREAEE